ncbi:hypothetical protein [Lysinibacillus irui]|uniref:Uncharacterized protein n=1 Tax=Lysinibacillus irui TaxID=2998077 RepID=A0AAJ5RUK9_9BACI|nr:hypothetical protein [Lysinibacillus irui]WDV09374.1 hypothetical protein OU989_22925 [Lysinibacillus irui]
MGMKVIKDINILRSMDLSSVNAIQYLGLVYKRITMVGEPKTTLFFYNVTERHLIKIKSNDYLLASYVILHKVSDNVYKAT